jgi:anti-anti-sigma factor
MTTDQSSPAADSLAFDGEMTIYSAAAHFQRLKEHLGKHSSLHLDLTQVAEIDCSGVQLLLHAQAEADVRGFPFSLVGVSETVHEALGLLFLKRTLDVPPPKQAEASA